MGSLVGNRSFRQRVSSPTTSSSTYEVDSPTSNVSSPTPLNYRIQGHFWAYTHINNNNLLFLVLLSTAEPNKPLYPELNAIQLIPRSFIHCLAKRKSILDIGFWSEWHISVGELTFDVGETTSVVGERLQSLAKWLQPLAKWLVGETTGMPLVLQCQALDKSTCSLLWTLFRSVTVTPLPPPHPTPSLLITHEDCVVPENIHTPTTEGISRKSLPSPRNFHFLNTKITPPPLRNFHKFYVHPPYPLDKIVLASKCVKVQTLSHSACHCCLCVIDRNIWRYMHTKKTYSNLFKHASKENRWNGNLSNYLCKYGTIFVEGLISVDEIDTILRTRSPRHSRQKPILQ